MKKKDIDDFRRSAFQWELLKLEQKYEEDIIMLFEKNYDVLSKKGKKIFEGNNQKK